MGLVALTILSVTFVLGMMVGREWNSSPPSEVGRDRRPALQDDEENGTRQVERAADIQEKLTFYRTLTAPLDSWSSPKPEARPREGTVVPAAHASPRAPASGQARNPAWTVQVAAFGAKGAATALSRSLAKAGFDAYVSLVTAENGRALYRVRIGSYPSRDAAEEVSHQLRSERALDPFVAPR
ncbi:MAG: SPOR domain-containing protein [Candidatus Methylomirabilia bacterium]